MVNNDSAKIVFLMMIAGRKQKEALVETILEVGGKLVSSMYGKGTVKANYLEEMFGLKAEENKVVISCLLPTEKSEQIFTLLDKRFHFNEPNTGIAFTMPVEGLAF